MSAPRFRVRYTPRRALHAQFPGDPRLKLLRSLFLASFAFYCLPAQWGQTQPQTQHPLTVEEIWGQPSPTGTPPQGLEWAPDAGRVTYLSPDSDLMQVLPITGATTALISHTKLSALVSSAPHEKDRDHRARYGMASYVWAPDSKHILFDSGGQLFIYSLDNGTAIDIASTGAGMATTPSFLPMGSSSLNVHTIIFTCIDSKTSRRRSNSQAPTKRRCSTVRSIGCIWKS